MEQSDDYYGAPGTKTVIDIEDLNRQGHEMMSREYAKPSTKDITKLKPLIQELLCDQILNENELCSLIRKYKFGGKRSFLFQVYLELLRDNQVSSIYEYYLRKTLQIKSVKSDSGITNITIFTSPYPSYVNQGKKITQNFSCSFSCHFCPNAPDMPRSYLLNEPAVLRAAKNEFDCVSQMHDRMDTLYKIGNDIFKLEVNILGGTFSSYPRLYLEEFIRDIYYAANSFWEPKEKQSLQDEKIFNETAKSRIVLIAVETRPDCITRDELIFYRYLSITRIQMGIQHTDDEILNKLNRKCPMSKVVQAIELLKRHGFKIDAHFMPNLPFSNPSKDRKMLIDELCGLKGIVKHEYKRTWFGNNGEHWEYYTLSNPELSCDQLKIYETAVVVHTEIEKWYKEKTYVPYNKSHLVDILLDFKTLVFPWIRLNRIMRDFYQVNIFSKSGSDLNLRNTLKNMLAKEGKRCNCIRCRQVKSNKWDGNYSIIVRKYNASNGDEYFISAEQNELYGFVRLRLDDAKDKIFKELDGCALLREAHVYSTVTNFDAIGNVQHRGIGKRLMKKAEDIAYQNGYKKMAVIAAVGSRGFYTKIGYHLNPGPGEYMIKYLNTSRFFNI